MVRVFKALEPFDESFLDKPQGSLPAPLKNQTIVSFCTTFVGVSVTNQGKLMYSVTPGKKLFVTSLNMVCTTGGANWQINDALNGADGARLVTGAMSQGISFPLTFPTPLQFSAGVQFLSQATQTFQFCFSGWEE
jgi:hypothetical protein